MSFGIHDGCPGPGYWERDNSHFPLPMSRHLWELFLPAYDAGTRRGLARYGSIIDHFDFARVKGRLYLQTCVVDDPEELRIRARASEEALATKLWRRDRAEWREVHERLRERLLQFSKADPLAMDLHTLHAHIASLRRLFVEGTLQHFFQQPSSMFPVGDWVRRTCEWTGATPAEALCVLRGSHPGSADFFQPLDRLDEYADRIITGFDIVDFTLRELPQLQLDTLRAPTDQPANGRARIEVAETEAQLRKRVPLERRGEFDEGLHEARASYGLHDEDVRITYLWPLGLIRRAMLAAAGQLIDRGILDHLDDIFQTTPPELDRLMASNSFPTAEELSRRAKQFAEWRHEKLPPAFGEREADSFERLPAACARVNAAITFYLGEMEGHRAGSGTQPPWSLMVAGLPASPGRYEGWARIVHDPADFRKLDKGDVLIAHTTSPAYNVILSMIGAVVTDRGGILCHCAIVAREFGIPAVVGTDQATTRIPDGARILVDGDRGFVAVRS